MSTLTKYEQETIINWNNEEKVASVYTYDKSLIRKIDRKISDHPEIEVIKRTEDFAEYRIPKRWIKVAFPRQLTDEQRTEMSLRMKAVREGTNV